MEGRGKSRRRNPFRIWKRRMGAVLAFVLTASLILNMPLSIRDFGLHVSDAYASGSNAQREDAVWATASNAKYKKAKTQDVDIYVIAEDSEAAAGNMSSMTLYLRNNTGEEITDGVLKFKANHIAKEDGYFTDVQVENEETAVIDSDDISAEISGEGLLYQEESIPAETDGQEMLTDDSGEWNEEETEEEEYNMLTGIDLAPGELYEVRFDFYTADDEKSTKAYVKFSFEGEGTEKKAKGEEKFYYSIGLPFVNVELADGYQLESGVQNEMNIWMSEPTWMDEDLEERVEAIEEAEEEKELDEAATASGSDAEKATDSNAEKASPSDASVSEKIEKYTQEAMAISESRVSYEVEIWGTEYKKFRPKKAQEAEDIGWISCLYEVARDAEPGIYYGKVSATGKWNRRSFASQQGFLFEVTGEGTIVLNGQLDGMEIQVSGPASAFPEAEELSISVSEVPDEQKAQVEEALKKKSEEEGIEIGRYRALDIRLYADGEETEPSGELQVAFKNMELTEQVTDESEISIQSENAPESSEQAGIAVLSAEQAMAGTETSGEESASAGKMNAGDSGSIKVYHLDEEATVANEMESSMEDSGDVVMTTDHFSVYIVVETGDEAVNSVTLTVQHWAEINVLAKNPETNLTGGSAGDLRNTYELVHDRSFTEIYSTDRIRLSNWTSVDIADLSKVVSQGAYTIGGVYLLKEGQTADDDMSNTTVWENITNRTNYTINKDSTIRIVYTPVLSEERHDAVFYDYDVRYTDRKGRTRYLINNSDNFDSSADRYLGFGNRDENGYTAYYEQNSWKFDHTYNHYIGGQNGVQHFVDSFDIENNRINYTNSIVDAGLFDGSDVPGKTIYENYDLNFKKTGDTYVLTNVYRNNNKLFGTDYELDGFHFESTNSGGIYTNGFWSLDKESGSDGKRSSLDGKSHNWFFGMRYDFQFSLGDYTGPLTYYFRGDDDFWLFVDGELAVDLGGIHDPIGQVVNLYEYLDDPEDKDAQHIVSIVYLERGGQASTCYMEFTIPNVTSVPVIPESERTSLTVNKTWDDNDNPYRPQNVTVQLYYKTAQENEYTKTWGGPQILNENNNWTYTWNGLAKSGYQYRVSEVSVPGYTTSYSPANGEAKQNTDGTYSISIKNQLTNPVSVAVEKVWDDNNSAERPDTVTMRLYWRDKGNSNDTWKPFGSANLILDGTAEEENENGRIEYAPWKGLYANLPSTIIYNGNSIDIEYTVFEMNGSAQIQNGGYLPGKNGTVNYAVKYETNSTTDGEGLKKNPLVKVTNKLMTAELAILKVDAVTEKPISGVEFTMLRKLDDGNFEAAGVTKTTDSNGNILFTNLYPGEYQLIETKAADGYYKPDEPWVINVAADGEITVNGTPISSSGDSIIYVIENQAGAELPETGGPGLIMIERFGWMLLILAMLGAEIQLFGRNRRKEQ